MIVSLSIWRLTGTVLGGIPPRECQSFSCAWDAGLLYPAVFSEKNQKEKKDVVVKGGGSSRK